MLQLRGTASYVRGFETSLSSEVLRICRPTSEPRDKADAALASGPEELLMAHRSGFTRAVLLGDHREFERSSFPNLLVVSQEFSTTSPRAISLVSNLAPESCDLFIGVGPRIIRSW